MSRQGLLCRDRACKPGTRPGLGALGWNARDKDSRPRVAIELSCVDRVWGWDWVVGVAIEGFSVVTKSFWFLVATVDGVATRCGQDQEALCHDTTIVS